MNSFRSHRSGPHRSDASASQTNPEPHRETSDSDGPEASTSSNIASSIPPEIAAELHAATLAVVLHTESHELKRSCASYWTRVMARHYRDEAVVERLRSHLRAVQRRAWRQAEQLGGGLIARGLAELTQGIRDDGPIDLEW